MRMALPFATQNWLWCQPFISKWNQSICCIKLCQNSNFLSCFWNTLQRFHILKRLIKEKCSHIWISVEKRVPWIGGGVGMLLGAIIVIMDNAFTKKPTLSVRGRHKKMISMKTILKLVIFVRFFAWIYRQHPSLWVIMVLVVAAIGFGIARGYLYYLKQQKIGMLEPPVNLLDEFKKPTDQTTNESAEGEPYTNRTRYTKAQARQRFKRGKT